MWGDDIKNINHCKDVNNLSDNELCILIKNGSNNAFEELFNRYVPLIKIKMASINFNGLEKEDMLQEGLLGLLKAAQTYDNNSTASFKTYAGICIERRLYNLYKSLNRKKDIPANDIVPLDDEGPLDINSEKHKGNDNPENVVIDKEENKLINHKIKKALSELEHKVLIMYIKGSTYKEISNSLCISTKSVDNAIQRIRKKLR